MLKIDFFVVNEWKKSVYKTDLNLGQMPGV